MTSRRNLLGAMLGLAGAITIGGCSSSTTGSSAAPGASAAPTKLRVGVVPGVDIGLLYLANEQGVFKNEGLTLEISEVQGPQVVTSVVSDQFDIGYAAWAPPLLAVAAGTDLVAVSGLATIGEKGHNGATLVRKDAGIKT